MTVGTLLFLQMLFIPRLSTYSSAAESQHKSTLKTHLILCPHIRAQLLIINGPCEAQASLGEVRPRSSAALATDPPRRTRPLPDLWALGSRLALVFPIPNEPNKHLISRCTAFGVRDHLANVQAGPSNI